VDKVQITDEVLVGSVWAMDVYENEKFLICDRSGKQLLLLDQNGNLIKQLNPEECHPGFNWNPLYSFFNREGEIYIINAAPWGFRFGPNGECIGPMDNTFLATYSYTFINDGKMIGYYTAEDGNYLKLMDENGNEIKRFGEDEFPDRFKNFIKRSEGGGVVSDSLGNIYQVNPNSPKVIKYNPQFQKVKEFEHSPDYFREIQEDLTSNPAKAIMDFGKKTRGKSLIKDIFLISPDKLGVQLYHQKEYPYGMIIYDLEGNCLIEDDIVYKKEIKAAEDGYVYFIEQPAPDEEGNLANPVILIYRMNNISN
jgi:hypothetical protein